MSKLFKYLNLTEADTKLLDPETMQMGEVVDIMQKTYMGAPDGRKKDTLANLIAETVALVLARVNSIKGLSKDAKKKIEEEAKELPKAPEMPKESPQDEPEQKEPPTEEKMPIEVGQFWMNNVIMRKMEITKIQPEIDLVTINVYNKEVGEAYYSLELALEKVKNGDWVLIKEDKEQKAPKEKPKKEQPPKEKPMPEDEPETEEEIRQAIQGLNILAIMGDNDVKIEIKRLKAKLKKK
jgi:hypothetical protein